jgi:hypothetical protein
MAVRRARGVLLRIVRRRRLVIALGVTLVAPAAWLEWSGGSGARWVDGLGFIGLATGTALIWTGVTGLKPDWIDET